MMDQFGDRSGSGMSEVSRRMPRNRDSDEDDFKKVARTPMELQRMKLDRLIKNIDKPVPIPNPKKEWKPPPPPDFVRNVVGSSAGAGSGEYHIYRNLRKKEYLRREYADAEAKREALDKAFEEKVTKKQQELEAKTSKKRAKRLKKKQNQKNKRKKSGQSGDHPTADSSGSSEESDAEEIKEAADGPPAVVDDTQKVPDGAVVVEPTEDH